MPPSGKVELLDADGDPTTSLEVAGGEYTIAAGVITFTPEPLFVGTAPAATYRVTDAYGQDAQATYTPTVTAPAGPTASPLTSTGEGTAVQHPASTVPAPSGGSVVLVVPGGTDDELTVTGQGTYALDTATGEFSFTPVLGFHGQADPVTYRVADAYGQTAQNTYTATVTRPAAPAPGNLTSTGVARDPAEPRDVVHGPAGRLGRLRRRGRRRRDVARRDWRRHGHGHRGRRGDRRAGARYQGTPTPLPVRVSDAYGQSGGRDVRPRRDGARRAGAAPAATTGTGTTPQTTTFPVPADSTITLVDGPDLVLRSTCPVQGEYVLDPDTGVVTFTPELGFDGAADPVTVRITDAYSQSGDTTYTRPCSADGPGRERPDVVRTRRGGAEHRAHHADRRLGHPARRRRRPRRPPCGSRARARTCSTPGVVRHLHTRPLVRRHAHTRVAYRVTDAYGQKRDDAVYTRRRAAGAPVGDAPTTTGVGVVPRAARRSPPRRRAASSCATPPAGRPRPSPSSARACTCSTRARGGSRSPRPSGSPGRRTP